MDKEVIDLIIIGGGPAGLSAALYSSRAGLKVVIYAGNPPGGQLMNTTDVENFPTQKSIYGPELINVMREQVNSFGALIKDEIIEEINFSSYPYSANIGSETIKFKSAVIATGAQALWLGLKEENYFKGKGLSACATCDGFFFKNKIVGVVGGGDTALEEALTLTKFASKVYIFHRRAEFKASKIMRDKVKNNEKIEIVWNSSVLKINGEQVVNSIDIKVEEEFKTIKLDGLFIAIGHKPDTQLFHNKVLMNNEGYILNYFYAGISSLPAENFTKTYPTMTSVDGIFAAGDCVDLIYRQASVASGMGVMASLDNEKWLKNK